MNFRFINTTFFLLADRDVCCYPGGYFYTCTQGCNGVNKPLSECAGRDTCYTCGDWSQQCTAGSLAGKFHGLLFSSSFKHKKNRILSCYNVDIELPSFS